MSRTEVESSERLGTHLIKVLGLDPDLVTSIDLHCSVGNMPRVTITRFVSSAETTALIETGTNESA